MENHDQNAPPTAPLGPAAQNTPGGGPPLIQQGAPQLPPQMFTTAAQLLDLTDSEYLPCRCCLSFNATFPGVAVQISRPKANKALLPEKLMLVLRDGRKLIGVLRSWDQFGTTARLISPSSRPRF